MTKRPSQYQLSLGGIIVGYLSGERSKSAANMVVAKNSYFVPKIRMFVIQFRVFVARIDEFVAKID